MEYRTIRLTAIGDELLAGHGDPRALGWYGRVLARTSSTEVRIESYTLAAPGEGTEALSTRWFDEAARRFGQNVDNRLVIALSDRDLDLGLSTARSRLNLANILDSASQMSIKALVVGPAPGLDPERNRPPGRAFTRLRRRGDAPQAPLRGHLHPAAEPRPVAQRPLGQRRAARAGRLRADGLAGAAPRLVHAGWACPNPVPADIFPRGVAHFLGAGPALCKTK